MKNSITIFLIISVLGIATFGFLAMNHANGHVGCIASAAQDGICPQESTPLGLASFYLDALRSFSKAVFLSVIFFIVLAATALLPEKYIPEPPVFYTQNGFSVTAENTLKRRFIHWLVLHEKRDPALHLSFRF